VHARPDAAITAVDGNICRCTGHSPIKKAIRRITEFLSLHPNAGGPPLAHLVDQKILPEYFLTVASHLSELQSRVRTEVTIEETSLTIVSGGTDLYVQKAFTMHAEPARRLSPWKKPEAISESADAIHIPGTTTVEEFRCSPVIGTYFPGLETQLLMFGSTPIRNRATVAGNLANASPIGDMTCLLMALDAILTLHDGDSIRMVELRKLYTGYKQLDKRTTEHIAAISIAKPSETAHLSYEKVSRRKYLDIASVNSTMAFDLRDGRMSNVGISAGGVGPTMLYLFGASDLLNGKVMDTQLFADAWTIASGEINPISDARGSAHYKRLLLRQLFAAHVLKFFPGVVKKEAFA
jgi:xanthine dehydrogenase small subunit